MQHQVETGKRTRLFCVIQSPTLPSIETAMIDIQEAIPHRPPFLFVDRVLEVNDLSITAEKDLPPDLDFFSGHYPHFPLMPGVLVCEAIFQAGAILLAGKIDKDKPGVPALTRIRDAKFKKMVRPGDKLTLTAEIEERLGAAFYMKGKATVNGKTAVTVHFTCAMVEEEPE